MSIGGPYSSVLNQVVSLLASKGFRVVVAAGNNRAQACYYSPASATGVLSVGAFGPSWIYARFSNYGKCVSLLAPGEFIQSTISGNRTAYYSGTSMAAPLVAGIWSLHP